jgi:nucleoside-diphosphate-sugar epimerase
MPAPTTSPVEPSNTSPPCAPDDVERFLSEPDDGVLETLRAMRGDILVLGAGGKMGLHLCLMLKTALARLGHADHVLAVSRYQTLHSTADFHRYEIETRTCDLADPDQLAALPDWPLVFFLAGAKFGTATNPELLQRMNVDVPTLVVERYRQARIVALSTGCVYAYVAPQTGGSVETDATAPVGDYALSCLGRERAFTAGSRQHGTPVTLVRLNYSVEFRYGVLVDICGKVLRGEPVNVAMGYVNVIWQRDALAQIIRTLPLASSPPFIINIAGDALLSVRELAHEFGRLLHQPVRIEGSEEPTAWLSNSAQGQRLFGKPRATLADMLRWTTAWVRGGGASYHKPTGFEKRDGKF